MLKAAEALGNFSWRALCPNQDMTPHLGKNPLNNQEEESPELSQPGKVTCSHYLEDGRLLGHQADLQKGVASVVGKLSPDQRSLWFHFTEPECKM